MAPRLAWRGGGDGWLRLVTPASLLLVVHTGVAAAQGAAATSADSLALMAAEAREALAATTAGRDGRAARLAEALARRGAIEEARATARQLATSWWPYARAAIAQRDSGDVVGALATARLAPELTDRAQAVGYLASAYAYSRDHDRALEITRTLEWPKQRVELLRLVASLLLDQDVARARALLTEAVGVARADTSHWGRYFEEELAYEQATAGDLASARRILPDTLAPHVRAERLGRLVTATRRMVAPSTARVADSLFREALRAADAVADSAIRARVRARVFWLSGAYGDSTAAQAMIRESRSAEERVTALVNRASTTALRGNDIDGALRIVSELERERAFRAAAGALTSTLLALPHRGVSLHGARPPEPPPLADAIARRAVANAAQVSAAFADTVRRHVVEYLTFSHAPLARTLAREIGDERLRARAMLLAGIDQLQRDPAAAAAFAAQMPPSVERDSLYLRTVDHVALDDPEAALTLVREIGAPALRAQAVASAAGVLLGRGDGTRARALYEQALALADPRTTATDRVLVRPLQSLGELARLRAWARSQPTAERRAEALVLVLETLPP